MPFSPSLQTMPASVDCLHGILENIVELKNGTNGLFFSWVVAILYLGLNKLET